jgi:ABC-type multidrug transport system ATPase subunit
VLAAPDPLCLDPDSGEDAVVAGYVRNSIEKPVDGFGDDGGGAAASDAPRDRLVGEACRRHLADVGLSSHALAQVGVGVHRLAGGVGEFEGGRGEHVLERRDLDAPAARVVQDGEVLLLALTTVYEKRYPIAVEAEGLRKRFRATEAVRDLNLTVPAGTIYGLLGPNGAGKSTTVKILATLLRPDAGHAAVLGHDVVRDAAAVRRRIALAGQAATVDEDLTGRENLLFLGRLSGLSRAGTRTRAAGLLEAFDLTAAGGRQVKTYSGGMRRRLDLAASFLVPADLYFLDEPTTGLDPGARSDVWQIVRATAWSGSTVLLTTQYLEEADRLADRVASSTAARWSPRAPPAELKDGHGKGTLDEVFLALTRRAEGSAA